MTVRGLRVRGWVWLLSMLWVAAGVAETGYAFYLSTEPSSWADVNLGIPGWSADPEVVRIAVVLATVAWLALPIPVLVAGFLRLGGWRRRNWLRAGAWAGAWIAGFALLYQALGPWGTYPGSPGCPCTGMPRIGSPAVVRWGELAICAVWLVLGAVMTWILAGPGPEPRIARSPAAVAPEAGGDRHG